MDNFKGKIYTFRQYREDYIRVIFFGNLTGNTFDAFLSRIRGVKAENSAVAFEFIFFLLNVPFLFPLSLLLKKKSGAIKS